MPCSAKLEIIALIAGAFFPSNSLVAPSTYFIGMAAIILSGIASKRRVFGWPNQSVYNGIACLPLA